MPSMRRLRGRANVIGRWVLVLHAGYLHAGTVLDKFPGSNSPKRIRIQRGPLQGEVVQPQDYEFRGFMDEQEIDP